MTTRESREVQLENKRPKRVTLRERKRDILTVPNRDPNYVYRIVNDEPGRITELQKWGYELAPETKIGENDGNISLGTGVRIDVGAGKQGVLMRQRREHWEEDQKAKQDIISENERLMIKKPRKSTESGEDGTYGEVSINR